MGPSWLMVMMLKCTKCFLVVLGPSKHNHHHSHLLQGSDRFVKYDEPEVELFLCCKVQFGVR